MQKKKKRSTLFNRDRENNRNSNNNNILKLFKNLNSSNYKDEEKSLQCFKYLLIKIDKKRAY